MTWAVNVLAPFLLASLLQDAVTGRIVNVSSISAGRDLDWGNLSQVGPSGHTYWGPPGLPYLSFNSCWHAVGGNAMQLGARFSASASCGGAGAPASCCSAGVQGATTQAHVPNEGAHVQECRCRVHKVTFASQPFH